MEQCLFEIEIFCNIMNVFSVTVSELNASLLNKTIHFYKCYSIIWLQFVSGAKEICFTLWRGGYWADFINPLSGKAVSTFISVQADEKLMSNFITTPVFSAAVFWRWDAGLYSTASRWLSHRGPGVVYGHTPRLQGDVHVCLNAHH